MSRIMVCVAHPDDEVLGMGGTIAKLTSEGHSVYVLICCRKRLGDDFSDELNQRYMEMARKAAVVLGAADVHFLNLPDEQPPEEQWHLLKGIERVARSWQPDTVYTHCMADYNQDHRAVCRACQTAFRPWGDVRALYHMEVPSSTMARFAPNYYVELSAGTMAVKWRAWGAYASEHRAPPHPRASIALLALETHRGGEVGVEYAEAFRIGFAKG